MKITVDYLKYINACQPAIIEYTKHGKEYDLIPLIRKMIRRRYYLRWANWLLVRCLSCNQRVDYAIYASKQLISIYEKEYPDDTRPRVAIEAVHQYLRNPSRENETAAYATSRDAHYAQVNYFSSRANAKAAVLAADFATTLIHTRDAFDVSDASIYVVDKKTKIKILKYGIKLIRDGEFTK